MDVNVKILLSTTENYIKGKQGLHYHIAYVDKMDMSADEMSPYGNGITSVNKEHHHEIINGLIEKGNGKHTHTLIEYAVKQEKEKQKDEDIVKDVLSLFKEAQQYEESSRKKAKVSEDFYHGRQWNESEEARLKDQKRAALTINEIEPKIDLLSGYQRRNRTDFKFLPVEEGDARIGDILNILGKNISEQCHYDSEETDAFDDMSITGRGLLNMYVDFNKDIRGNIIIEKYPWMDCFFGPHEKRDISDCEYLVKTKWYSRARLKQMWPDKYKKIQNDFTLAMGGDKTDTMGSIENPHHVRPGEQYSKSTNTIETSPFGNLDLVDIAKQEYRILECWRKVYKRNKVVINSKDGFYFNAAGWADTDIKSVQSLGEFNIIEIVSTTMRISRIAAGTLLDDGSPDIAMDDFLIFPLYAKKRGANWWGKIENVKDTQREINKRHSQAVDIINKTATYGWFYDSETFPTPGNAKDFRDNVSTPGFTAEVRDITRPPVAMEGVKFPAEIVRLEELATQKLREIMNINLEMAGLGGLRQSGIAIAERKEQGLIGNEFLFDNLDVVKRRLGKMMVVLIKQYYSPERIMRIIENQDKRQPIMLGGQPLENANKQEILQLLENADLMKYDIIVSQSPFSASMREATFAVWLELAKVRQEIPLDWLIELSDLPDKEKFREMLAKHLQEAQEQEDKKYKTELLKTAMAKGMPIGASSEGIPTGTSPEGEGVGEPTL
ncbi:MAG: hypothetical protein AABY40_02700 [Nanoarchaeota archaeon]